MTAIDWQALFFEPRAEWPARLMARARRRYGGTPDAEAAYNHAFQAISENGWSRLSDGYRGSGTAEGFMAITFLNLLEEYAVRKYGRPRPPAWLQRLGGLWKRVFELLCLRRLEPQFVVDLLCGANARESEVRAAIREVRARIPRCGEHTGEQEDDGTIEQEPGLETPASELEQGELAHLLDVLAGLFGQQSATQPMDTAAANRARARIAALEHSLALTGEERLLLRLVYEENCSIPEAARQLSLNERTARRAHARLMDRLRAALTEQGLDGVRFALVE
jgi:DNA-directed RNA polymerase specialized sigma24 family protein